MELQFSLVFLEAKVGQGWLNMVHEWSMLVNEWSMLVSLWHVVYPIKCIKYRLMTDSVGKTAQDRNSDCRQDRQANLHLAHNVAEKNVVEAKYAE